MEHEARLTVHLVLNTTFQHSSVNLYILTTTSSTAKNVFDLTWPLVLDYFNWHIWNKIMFNSLHTTRIDYASQTTVTV